MKHFNRLLASAAAVALLAATAPAMAECMGEKHETTAQQKSDEAVANAKVDPQTGETEAATGGAKPVENWSSSCPPGSKKEGKCLSKKGKQQEKQAADSAESGKTAEKPADPGVDTASRSAPTGAGSASTDGGSGTSTTGTSTAAASQATDGECGEEKKPS